MRSGSDMDAFLIAYWKNHLRVVQGSVPSQTQALLTAPATSRVYMSHGSFTNVDNKRKTLEQILQAPHYVICRTWQMGLHGKAVPASMWESRHAGLKGASAPVRCPCMASGAIHGNQAANVAGHMPRNARYCCLGGLAWRHAAPHGLNDLQGPGVSRHAVPWLCCMRSLPADRPAGWTPCATSRGKTISGKACGGRRSYLVECASQRMYHLGMIGRRALCSMRIGLRTAGAPGSRAGSAGAHRRPRWPRTRPPHCPRTPRRPPRPRRSPAPAPAITRARGSEVDSSESRRWLCLQAAASVHVCHCLCSQTRKPFGASDDG